MSFSARLRSIVPVTTPRLSATGASPANSHSALIATGSKSAARCRSGSSGWCLCCERSPPGRNIRVLDNFVYATTSPVYVSVRGERRAHRRRALFQAWIDHLLQTTGSYPDWNSVTE